MCSHTFSGVIWHLTPEINSLHDSSWWFYSKVTVCIFHIYNNLYLIYIFQAQRRTFRRHSKTFVWNSRGEILRCSMNPAARIQSMHPCVHAWKWVVCSEKLSVGLAVTTWFTTRLTRHTTAVLHQPELGRAILRQILLRDRYSRGRGPIDWNIP